MPHRKLRSAREEKGFASAAEAARHFGWPIPTYCAHENGTRGIRRDAAIKYAKAYGIQAAALLGLSTGSQPRHDVALTPIVARCEWGVWRDMRIDSAAALGVVPDPYAGQGRFGVAVADDSVSRRIAPGSIAICDPFDLSGLTVSSLVVIQQTQGDYLVETTIRRVSEIKGSMVTLTPDSKSGIYAEILTVDADQPNVHSIKGIVVGVYTPLT